MSDTPEVIIESEVKDLFELEKLMQTAELELSQVAAFQNFIELQKRVQERSATVWKHVEEQMIEHDVKSIKGDWGTLTIAERIGFDTTDELPAKFYKKVIDTKRLADTYRLEGKDIKGATVKYTKYLTRRLK